MKKFSVVLVGLLAGIAFALQVPSNGAAEAVTTSVVDADDCIYCLNGGQDDADWCPVGWHDAWEPVDTDPNFTRNGGAHYTTFCYEDTCHVKHGPECNGGGTFAMVDMDRLRGSIEAKDVQAVKDLLANHTESTVLNAKRSAVQVMDCEGTVIAHFPVGQKLLDRVSAE